MTSKNTFATIGILAVLLMSLGMVSAATSDTFSITDVSAPTSVMEDEDTFTFTFNLTYTSTSTSMDFSFADSTATIGTISIPDETGLDGTVDESRIVTGTITGLLDQGGETLIVRINASSETAGQIDDETTFTVSITDVYDYCDEGDDFSGEVGTLEIADFEINNLGQGDEDEWELLDELEIELEIENTDNDDNVNDVMVEIMILDDSDDDVTSDFDLDEEKIDLGRIRDGESEFATFKISEVPADLDGKYRLYFRAYSDDDEESHCVASSGDFDEDNYQEIEVITLGSPAVVIKPEWGTVLASCGDNNVEVYLDVYNLGEDKEEKILVNLYSSILGIDEKITINDLRSGKRREIVFVFDVPEELANSYYNLDVVAYYDYDKDEDELSLASYGESSYNDLDKDFAVRLEILSCRGPDPTVSANLESIAEIGSEMTVKSLITNNGEDNDFVISLSGFEDWADLVSITPQTASINKGEFVEVTVVLAPTESGTQSFKINTIVDGESYEKPVSVNVAKKPTVFSKINDAMDGNAVLYISMGIIALFIAIVSVLIIKVSKKKVNPQF